MTEPAPVIRSDACERCGQHQAMHFGTNKRLCCWCYIGEGNPPAEWHTVCMSEHQRRKPPR